MNFISRQLKLNEKVSQLIQEAKEYIVANCHRVDDWSDMNLIIKNGNNRENPNKLEEGYYCSKSAIALRLERKAKREASGNLAPSSSVPNYFDFYGDDDDDNQLGPIKNIYEPILDESDGDFSITIDGLEWWWIDDSAIISLAAFIENALDRKRKINTLLNT